MGLMSRRRGWCRVSRSLLKWNRGYENEILCSEKKLVLALSASKNLSRDECHSLEGDLEYTESIARKSFSVSTDAALRISFSWF